MNMEGSNPFFGLQNASVEQIKFVVGRNFGVDVGDAFSGIMFGSPKCEDFIKGNLAYHRCGTTQTGEDIDGSVEDGSVGDGDEKCIHKYYVCDGYEDCDNGSDEKDCDKGKEEL